MAESEPSEAEATMNTLPDPGAFTAASHGHGKKKKKFKDSSMSASEVNINSLLDVLSVILVFLMKSYSANSVQIKPSHDLQVPISHSTAEVQESTTITVTLKNILMDDIPVLTLDGGKLPAEEMTDNLVIASLFTKLQEAVDHEQKIALRSGVEFKGVVTLIGDRNVSFDLMTRVMNTAGQAKYSKFKFAAIKMERG